jgi:hypothetical protein
MNHPSRPRSIGAGLTPDPPPWATMGAGGIGTLAAGSAEANDGPPKPGRAATATP